MGYSNNSSYSQDSASSNKRMIANPLFQKESNRTSYSTSNTHNSECYSYNPQSMTLPSSLSNNSTIMKLITSTVPLPQPLDGKPLQIQEDIYSILHYAYHSLLLQPSKLSLSSFSPSIRKSSSVSSLPQQSHTTKSLNRHSQQQNPFQAAISPSQKQHKTGSSVSAYTRHPASSTGTSKTSTAASDSTKNASSPPQQSSDESFDPTSHYKAVTLNAETVLRALLALLWYSEPSLQITLRAQLRTVATLSLLSTSAISFGLQTLHYGSRILTVLAELLSLSASELSEHTVDSLDLYDITDQLLSCIINHFDSVLLPPAYVDNSSFSLSYRHSSLQTQRMKNLKTAVPSLTSVTDKESAASILLQGFEPDEYGLNPSQFTFRTSPAVLILNGMETDTRESNTLSITSNPAFNLKSDTRQTHPGSPTGKGAPKNNSYASPLSSQSQIFGGQAFYHSSFDPKSPSAIWAYRTIRPSWQTTVPEELLLYHLVEISAVFVKQFSSISFHNNAAISSQCAPEVFRRVFPFKRLAFFVSLLFHEYARLGLAMQSNRRNDLQATLIYLIDIIVEYIRILPEEKYRVFELLNRMEANSGIVLAQPFVDSIVFQTELRLFSVNTLIPLTRSLSVSSLSASSLPPTSLHSSINSSYTYTPSQHTLVQERLIAQVYGTFYSAELKDSFRSILLLTNTSILCFRVSELDEKENKQRAQQSANGLVLPSVPLVSALSPSERETDPHVTEFQIEELQKLIEQTDAGCSAAANDVFYLRLPLISFVARVDLSNVTSILTSQCGQRFAVIQNSPMSSSSSASSQSKSAAQESDSQVSPNETSQSSLLPHLYGFHFTCSSANAVADFISGLQRASLFYSFPIQLEPTIHHFICTPYKVKFERTLFVGQCYKMLKGKQIPRVLVLSSESLFEYTFEEDNFLKDPYHFLVLASRTPLSSYFAYEKSRSLVENLSVTPLVSVSPMMSHSISHTNAYENSASSADNTNISSEFTDISYCVHQSLSPDPLHPLRISTAVDSDKKDEVLSTTYQFTCIETLHRFLEAYRNRIAEMWMEHFGPSH